MLIQNKAMYEIIVSCILMFKRPSSDVVTLTEHRNVQTRNFKSHIRYHIRAPSSTALDARKIFMIVCVIGHPFQERYYMWNTLLIWHTANWGNERWQHYNDPPCRSLG
jgi:hypothetical protein